MAEALIGNLAVLLSMDTAAFEQGNSHASKLLRRTQRDFEKMGQRFKDIGQSFSKFVTLPVLGAGAGVIKMAGDFEASMNKVSISTQAGAKDMADMRDLALDIGKTTTKSASESAEAMDMLAKAGLDARQILDGAARATVALAEAAGSDLDPAAAAITDTMAQFRKTTADLPQIINNITGAVNESKFDFADFQLGMAQAGGVASSAGVSFEEFTATLAGTASMFASGSDAGTSLKNFLNFLIPKSADAAAAMEEYGLTFFRANGEMKDMADIAQMLQERLGKLSEKDRNAALHAIFGTDAMRTAIGLMKIGASGFEEMQGRIQATDASAQAAQRMQGFNAEMEKLKGSVETLAIAIADSGMLQAVTGLVTKVAEWVDWMSEASPETLKWATILLAVGAAVGPLLIGIGAIVSSVGTLLPLIIKLGPAFAIMKAGIVALTPLIWGAVKALAAMALTPVGAVITAVAVAVGGLYLAWKNWDKIKPIVVALYNTVKTYVLDKLNAVWDAVKAGVDRVKGFFYGLWDAVVGHSYIPDMVDGIRDQMARLDAVMVQPAKTATERTKAEFERLQGSVKGVLDRLFPEVRDLITLERELADLATARDRKMITPDEYAEAVKRLRLEKTAAGPPVLEGIADEWAKPLKEVNLPKSLDDLLVIPAKKATAEVVESFANMARDAVGSFRNMIDAFKSGDILSGLSGVLDLVGQAASLFGGKSAAAVPTYNRSPIPRAMGGPVVPGKKYVVGEKGREYLTVGQRGWITPGSNDNGRRGGMTTIHMNGVMTNDDFWSEIDKRGISAQLGAVSIVEDRAARRSSRSLRGRR